MENTMKLLIRALPALAAGAVIGSALTLGQGVLAKRDEFKRLRRDQLLAHALDRIVAGKGSVSGDSSQVDAQVPHWKHFFPEAPTWLRIESMNSRSGSSRSARFS